MKEIGYIWLKGEKYSGTRDNKKIIVWIKVIIYLHGH
jgi:hypothetical protein